MEDMIHKLEAYQNTQEIDIQQLLHEYKEVYQDRPVWRMVEDIQRQAMIYSNVIELLKSGKQAATIKKKLEALELVPPGKLPNPDALVLLTKAFSKLSQYRKALIDIIKQYGGELLNELDFEPGLTISVGVNVGFPPSVTIAVEHTAKVQTISRY